MPSKKAGKLRRGTDTRFYLPTRRNPVHFPSTLYADDPASLPFSPFLSHCLSAPLSPFPCIFVCLFFRSGAYVYSLVLETNYRARLGRASAISLRPFLPLTTAVLFLCLISRLNLHRNVRRLFLNASSLFGHRSVVSIAICATIADVWIVRFHVDTHFTLISFRLLHYAPYARILVFNIPILQINFLFSVSVVSSCFAYLPSRAITRGQDKTCRLSLFYLLLARARANIET